MTTNSNIAQELEQEFDRFIAFGGILDKQMRRYLVQYLQNKFEPERHIIPILNDRYYDYFTRALDKIFLIEGLLKISTSNEKIRHRIILDTLYWLRQTYKKVRKKEAFEEEKERLEGWSITPLHIFVKRWSALPIYLRSVYDRTELDHLFFEQQFKELIRARAFEQFSTEEAERLEVLVRDLLAQWDALLYAKILEYQLKKFDEEQDGYLDFMNKKVQEYHKLQEFLDPVSDYLGWDLSRKLWQDTSFDTVKEYSELLKDENAIKELADLLGSMREAEIEIEEETFEKTIIRQEWVVDEFSRSSIVGVHHSDELPNMLSSEASLLSDVDTELLFLKKFADKKLMTFKYEDRKLVQSEDHFTEIHQRVNQKEKGPFIICVDTSESMMGRPEKIAKVLTLGILKMAMHQNRRAYLINFSIGIQTIDLYDIANSINEIAKFLKMSFYGGTDATLALYEAFRQLGTHDYEDADVLMVSDFIMHKVQADVLNQIRHYQQNKGTQFHCLTLSEEANTEVLEFFDTNWVYDPHQKGIIRSLTRGLNDIMER